MIEKRKKIETDVLIIKKALKKIKSTFRIYIVKNNKEAQPDEENAILEEASSYATLRAMNHMHIHNYQQDWNYIELVTNRVLSKRLETGSYVLQDLKKNVNQQMAFLGDQKFKALDGIISKSKQFSKKMAENAEKFRKLMKTVYSAKKKELKAQVDEHPGVDE